MVVDYTSSCFQLDGADAPYVTRRQFRDIPEGEWDAVLMVNDKVKTQAHFIVIGRQ